MPEQEVQRQSDKHQDGCGATRKRERERERQDNADQKRTTMQNEKDNGGKVRERQGKVITTTQSR